MNSETSNKSIEIVIPDDYPPVFDDSAALARLRRLPGIKVRTYSDRPQNSEELIQRISGAHTVVLGSEQYASNEQSARIDFSRP
ncbi:MAG: hypothetical protein CM1200mP39_27640 [Dehalococcoidia bacterium]|nr:MAG: hypothetical protein CM1200mP39_27640 [Dehalococcoidia bacterium]